MRRHSLNSNEMKTWITRSNERGVWTIMHLSHLAPWIRLDYNSFTGKLVASGPCTWLALVHVWLPCAKVKLAYLARSALLSEYVHSAFISKNGKGQLDTPLRQVSRVLHPGGCIFEINRAAIWGQHWGGAQERGLGGFLQHWDGARLNFTERKRPKILFKQKKTKQK